MSKTRIVVIQMKEIIYTALFAGLAVLLIVLLVFIFKPENTDDANKSEAKYNAGTYTSQLALNNTALNLEVTVDPDRITSIRLVNISDAVTTMFPLLEPALNELETQILEKQSTKDLKISDNSRYTQTLLIDAIDKVISRASVN